MNNHLVYSSVSRQQFKDAVQWYEDQRAGLGDEFANEVERKVAIIGEYPERYSIKRGHFRTTLLRKYPYLIVYRFNKAKRIITVTSIYHTKRSPQHKYRR